MKIELRLSIRMFGYSQAVARVQSHFFRVEEGTEFAISDLRLHCIGSTTLVIHMSENSNQQCFQVRWR